MATNSNGRKRLKAIIAVIVLSAVAAWFGEPFVRGNSEFFIAVVTIFTVFGGFLVAVMSVSGERLIGKPGSWQVIELGRDAAVHRMNRAQLLFYIYLIAAVLIIVVLALQKSCDPVLSIILKWVDFLGLWFTAMGILFSFALPTMLNGIQQAKIDAEIEDRRKRADNGDSTSNS